MMEVGNLGVCGCLCMFVCMSVHFIDAFDLSLIVSSKRNKRKPILWQKIFIAAHHVEAIDYQHVNFEKDPMIQLLTL